MHPALPRRSFSLAALAAAAALAGCASDNSRAEAEAEAARIAAAEAAARRPPPNALSESIAEDASPCSRRSSSRACGSTPATRRRAKN